MHLTKYINDNNNTQFNHLSSLYHNMRASPCRLVQCLSRFGSTLECLEFLKVPRALLFNRPSVCQPY